MRIAIIGAGIGGLTAAAALQQDGHAITVLEQRPHAGALGAGLSLYGSSFAALRDIGLGEALAPLTPDEAGPRRAGLRDSAGRWLARLPPRSLASLRTLHRVDLHGALAQVLEPGILHSGCAAHVPEDGTGTVTVTSTVDEAVADPVAGSTATFDLVIAADGIQSRTRSTLGLDTGLRYAGYTAWRGLTRTPVELGGTVSQTWGFGQRFGIAGLPDGRVYWFATDSVPEGCVFEDEKAALLERFGGWHDPIRGLLESTEPSAINRHDIHDLTVPLSSFVKGRTVLLGDAAHAMTPDLGQGAGQAIEDAATLTLLLRGQRGGWDIDRALGDYDRIRRRRSHALARRSRWLGRLAQWDSPGRARLRDVALRVTPSALVGLAAARAHRWRPPRRR